MYYGLDIGGTKIEFGAFDEDMNRIATKRVSTPSDNYDALVQAILDLVVETDAAFNIKGKLGIGIPGIECPKSGELLTSNIPGATGKNLRKTLEEKLDRTIAIDNDANCFALSEAWSVNSTGNASVLGLIHGTGFGGGIVVKGVIHKGKNHSAGELGHTTIPLSAWKLLGEDAPLFTCGCGKQGCLDEYLSGRGFEQLYKHYYKDEKSAVEIIELYNEGSVIETEFVEMFFELVSICYANLFSILDPNIVVLGGGLSNFDAIYKEVPKRISKYLLSVANAPIIMPAKFGDSGGVRGAALLNYN
ncbi:N-acetylglucosamine kinase [Vibrio spartinae]|uniref:N-acetylglucosamine kinase n=1 Tax=Vibrio spartinae TaxID=1918945 RepID=A0A1N6MAX9_9VIBR|nr:N-acetylglucosamine kinase [Vibrio spartinae]QMV13789.1 N-acetyl-D-glucosamine kinase [Vibrio spartinae]SIO96571.1 N-acetyl-D-glucosamine kinase [Vibrio spartinae]